MLVALGWLLVLGLSRPTILFATARHDETEPRQNAVRGISVWTDRESVYRRGDEARIYFRTDEPAYVTVLRVDTDGRIRTLFPRDPWGGTYVRGGRTLEVAASKRRGAFTIEDDPGIGYLFAIASPSPFNYDEITRGDYWDFRLIDNGRIRGDPYVALTDLASRIAPRGGYRYDITPYYVEHRYDYPRFACYDCHSYASYEEWNPYATSCARYRIVIYDDPAYYPYRYNQGRNVVVGRPVHPRPRYVFKDAEPGTEYVTRLRQRQSDSRRRVGTDRGRTSADVGGPGVIPAPSLAPVRPQDSRGEGRRRADPVEPRKIPPVQRGARNPQSTGEPELRRRKP